VNLDVDEKLCPSTNYRCANQYQCIDIHQVMDGIEDCLDSSDENRLFSGITLYSNSQDRDNSVQSSTESCNKNQTCFEVL